MIDLRSLSCEFWSLMMTGDSVLSSSVGFWKKPRLWTWLTTERKENATAVANHLGGHLKVKRVLYPGLESHRGHEIARRQMRGFRGVISSELAGGSDGVNTFRRKVKVFSLAESLGGVTSLAEHPATMSHASMSKGYREKIGITDELIRLSVGLENIDDLTEDLEQALESL